MKESIPRIGMKIRDKTKDKSRSNSAMTRKNDKINFRDGKITPVR